MELKIQIPKFLYPALYNDHKISNIVAARRTGKTFNTAQWIIDELLGFDPNIAEPAGLWVDTTQSNIDKYVEREFAQILRPIRSQVSWNAQKKILKLGGYAYIDFGSAERPENMEGRAYARGVLNESGIILKKAALWDNTLYPMFKNDYTKVRNIGTPKGKNKFHQLSIQYPTWHFNAYDSPFWTAEQIEIAKKTMPAEVFRQEMLAEFIEGAGSVFRNITSCVREIKTTTGDVMGVDLAKHHDFTVITIGNTVTKEIVYIDKFNQIDWTFQKKRIYAAWERFKRPKLVIDSTGVGDAIYDDLKRVGMIIEGYKFTNESKKELIQNLSVALENGEIFIPPNQELLSELEVFGYDISPSGNIRYGAPDGFFDDMVISLALTNHLFKNTIKVDFSWL